MKSSIKYALGGGIPLLAAIALACVAISARAVPNDSGRSSPDFTRFASAPLCFEKSGGQDGAARFIARGAQCSVFLAPTEAEIVVGNGLDEVVHGQERSPHSVRLKLAGANPAAKMTGLGQLSARANYFIGNDPSKWRAGVPLFSKVQADEIYPGVSVVYYANQSAQLEYDFVLQAGARPEQIRFAVEGADSVGVDSAGDLVLKIGGDEISQRAPVVYQENGGAHRQIRAGYRLNNDGTIGLDLAGYDRGASLTIDPVLDFLTYMGSNRTDIGWAIALDTNTDNIFVTGETLSKNLPTTNSIVFPEGGTNRYFTNYQGGTAAFGDAFVASYDTSGALRYLTYLGGKRDDGALGIAADGSGGVWLTGFTDSTNFPITPGAVRTNLTGPNNNALQLFPADAFIAHLDPTGSNLDYSTYFGGSDLDEGVGIAVVNSNQVYVTGLTSSTNLLGITTNSFQSTNTVGELRAFVTELIDGTNRFTTYLGGTNATYGLSIALDSTQNSWITGITFATNFPTTNWLLLSNTFEMQITKQSTNGFAFESGHFFAELNNQTNSSHHNTSFHSDAFVSELSPDGTTLLFSVYLGGTNDDSGAHITIDSSDNVYVTGYTFCPDFPTNVVTGLFYPDYPTNTSAFPSATTNFFSHVFVTELTKAVAEDGSTNYVIGYSTAFGGNSADRGTGIAVDNNGFAYVTGSTSSTNFFQTNVVILTNGIDESAITNKHGVVTNYVGIPTNNITFTNLSGTNVTTRLSRFGVNSNDVFVAVLSPGGTNFVHSILVGGPGIDTPNGIAVDPAGSAVYLVGSTTSRTNFATTNAAQPFFGGRGNRLPDAFVGKIELSP